jgi:hypothetical protein
MYEWSRQVFVNFYEAQELIPPAYVAWRAGTTLFSTRFLALIDYIFKNSSTEFFGVPALQDRSRPNSWTKSRQFVIHSHLHSFALRFLFLKLAQPPTVSRVQLQYTIKEKGGKPDRASFGF